MIVENNKQIYEGYLLSIEKIKNITLENNKLGSPYQEYFQFVSEFILEVSEIFALQESGKLYQLSLPQLEEQNMKLYQDITGDAYIISYANPQAAAEKLGTDFGTVLSFLYTEIRSMIPSAFEGDLMNIAVLSELFIQIYTLFEQNADLQNIKDAIYIHMDTYCDVYIQKRIQTQFDSKNFFAKDIICKADLSEPRYLYFYGEYISENERKMSIYLNGLSEEKIEAMAATVVDGFIRGFTVAKKNLNKMKTINVRFYLGFERMIRAVIGQLKEKADLEAIIFRYAANCLNKKQTGKIGYWGTSPNPQYDFDHKFDLGLFLDEKINAKRLESFKAAYESVSEQAGMYAGPMLIEVFGEVPFEPLQKNENIQLTKEQQRLILEYTQETSQISNTYVKHDEISFTIISYPIPEIGPQFEEIFDAVIDINTLDVNMYEAIQQTIIDTLDLGEYVHIKGQNGNETDLVVMLHPLSDPGTQSNFENCTADVNIPVGEVFTSPRLTGTHGVLHVKEVYLRELKYVNLKITFENGFVTEYTCSNYENESDNQKMIKENLLYHHESLPIGEFAIGTNTAAYVMANQYQILHRLPILIVEKMGPHFAIGDTCYSHSEDAPVYNPDGKEVVARDNEASILRNTDISKAYFHCHTDITIPYDEIGCIEAVEKNGIRHKIIENSRFVLVGIDELNHVFG